MINACGPWANVVHNQFFSEIYPIKNPHLRLVRGSHLLVKKISTDAFLLPNESDGRIVFVLPYQQFSIIGTTEVEQNLEEAITISDQERSYLLDTVNKFIDVPLSIDDILQTYSGIRPLIDDEASSNSALSREFKVNVYMDENEEGQPKKPILVSLLGGKITTFQLLGKEVCRLLSPLLDDKAPIDITALTGSNLSVINLEKRLHYAAPFLLKEDITRLIRAYGKTCLSWFYGSDESQLGEKFSQGVFQVEIDYLLTREWVYNFEDLMLRRSKFDWQFTVNEKTRLEEYVQSRLKLYQHLSQSSVNLHGSKLSSDLSVLKLFESQVNQAGHQSSGF